MPTPAGRYRLPAQFLHWLIAALVVVQFLLACRADRMPLGIERLVLLARHKSVGMTILMLTAVRLAWRLRNPPPPLPAAMPALERRLARGAHAAFYVLLFAMPLSGWLMSSAKNYAVSWFGWFTWPDLIGKSEPAFERLRTLHHALGYALLALAIVHLLAAFRHQFWLRDGLLARMWPWGNSAEPR